ncbi:MAG: exodeoxyribonuclease VII small subunit [Acidaminococcaceae bacterium]|nr:exodeoxyribonuclease VII small subunit [Acidaminococcaceae bacterium]
MKKIAKNIKFEDALAELEQQVQLLESGELPLEEALAAFQQGVALSKVCMTKLNTVQQEVEKIVVADNGSDNEYELETFADLED